MTIEERIADSARQNGYDTALERGEDCSYGSDSVKHWSVQSIDSAVESVALDEGVSLLDLCYDEALVLKLVTQ